MNKNNIEFIDTSKEVKDTMVKLSKSALRAAGRVVGKELKKDTRYRTKNLKNHIGFWAKIDRKTGQPELQIGYYSRQKVKKKGKKPSHANPHWFEFGIRPHIINVRKAKSLSDGNVLFGKKVYHPGLKDEHLLRETVLTNIDKIQEAESKYLSELNKTIDRAKNKIIDSEDDADV